jgi:hypothetical protein
MRREGGHANHHGPGEQQRFLHDPRSSLEPALWQLVEKLWLAPIIAVDRIR